MIKNEVELTRRTGGVKTAYKTTSETVPEDELANEEVGDRATS